MIADHIGNLDRAIGKAELLLSRMPDHGCDTDYQSVRLQSFVLLTHSAIELFVESLSKDAALCSVKKFKTQNIISASLISLISSGILAEATKSRSKAIEEAVISDITVFAENAYGILVTKINANNGIRRTNIDTLLLPIGVSGGVEDIPAYNTVDTYANKRGDIAHKFGSIQTHLTKVAVRAELKVIRDGLASYEAAARLALATGMSPATSP